MLRVSNCIAACVRLAIPQPTEWQRVGKQFEAAMILRELTILAKPVGVWAGSQSLILEGEQSGLLTRITATVSGSLCVRTKS